MLNDKALFQKLNEEDIAATHILTVGRTNRPSYDLMRYDVAAFRFGSLEPSYIDNIQIISLYQNIDNIDTSDKKVYIRSTGRLNGLLLYNTIRQTNWSLHNCKQHFRSFRKAFSRKAFI